MARSEGRLQFGIWREGLEGYGSASKLVYCVLLTEPTVTHAGVGAWRPSRWARNASLTGAETEKALAELTAGDPLTAPVVVDEDTEEVLVRTLIRNDGVADQPYVLKSALTAALAVQSPLLRWVLAQELRKLPPRKPDSVSPKSKRVIVYPDPHAAADVLDPRGPTPPAVAEPPSADPLETLSEPSANPSAEKGLETLGGGGGGGGGGSSSSVGGHFGGSRASARKSPAPNDPTQTTRCPRHAALSADADVPPCGQCAERRRAAERHLADGVLGELAARTHRRAAIDACRLCDDHGMREHGDALARCTHPTLEAVG